MARRKIVAGNWKMNLNLDEATSLAASIVEQSVKIAGVEKIIFPAFPFLQKVGELIAGRADMSAGAQNCSEYEKGAYTGDVGASMIKSVGAGYVMIGHSERRQYFSESAEQLRAKIKQSLANNLQVVFCFGEHLKERENNQHFATVKQQLVEVLSAYPNDKTNSLVLAYEPVWAIGTGLTASPAQAQEMHAFVRSVLAEVFGTEIATQLPILYGGSCNAQNAKELFAGADVDGGLIGGASLKAEDFCTIMTSFS
jgi:triosephosphate isomerase